ncbi:hypothetical protein F4Z99_00795 [Candidatus Poribacteria bacterium]|nr:hypothetical protein [Candidatus Poribacteria bacterium]
MKNIPFPFFSALSLILVLASGDIVFARAPTTARIVFFSLRDGNADIYTMAPDGSQQRNLTKHPSTDREPVWSPTGAHILFASDRTGILDLYLMDPNGADVRKVFRVSAPRKHPSWSPDGKRIAYVKRQTIYIATIDGEMEEQIAKVGERGGSPAWSPDGSELAFVRKEPDGYQLVLINVETLSEKTLFPQAGQWIYNPSWSPDGSKIAFSWWNEATDTSTLYTINQDGDGRQKIFSPGRRPVWSPHGDELLYEDYIPLQLAHIKLNLAQIYKIALGSHEPERLTNNGANFDPDWFDPAVLSVAPQSQLFTTVWGKIKKQN